MKKSFLIILLTLSFFLLDKKEEKVVIDIPKEKIKIKEDFIKPHNFEFQKNKFLKGSLAVLNTEFLEPIYKYHDNEFFLSHSPSLKEDLKGASFLDYRVDENSKIKIIYSHNTFKLNLPFSFLENYYNSKDFQKRFPYFKLSIKDDEYYKVVSTFVETKSTDTLNLNVDKNHFKNLIKKSIYDYKETIDENDDILILQTCSKSEDYENFKDKYLFIILKKINPHYF